jgi:hypothetical protein
MHATPADTTRDKITTEYPVGGVGAANKASRRNPAFCDAGY